MHHPLILHIESSTELCSVALSQGSRCVAFRDDSEGRNHSSLLTVFVDDILNTQGVSAKDLDAVAFSSGPGSYTGLRIGLSAAKGLCFGGDLPLIAVPTLQAMSVGFALQKEMLLSHPLGIVDDGALLCPMIDARRMEVYTGLYDMDGREIEAVSAEIITEQSFSVWLERGRVYFFGNGAAKCRSTISHVNAVFVESFAHSSQYMIPFALRAYNDKQFVDTAYFEPYYLKDFIAGSKKNQVLL